MALHTQLIEAVEYYCTGYGIFHCSKNAQSKHTLTQFIEIVLRSLRMNAN